MGVRSLFQLLDTKQKGVVDIDEFVVGMMRPNWCGEGRRRGHVVVRLQEDRRDDEGVYEVRGGLEALLDCPTDYNTRSACVEEYVEQEETSYRLSEASEARSQRLADHTDDRHSVQQVRRAFSRSLTEVNTIFSEVHPTASFAPARQVRQAFEGGWRQVREVPRWVRSQAANGDRNVVETLYAR